MAQKSRLTMIESGFDRTTEGNDMYAYAISFDMDTEMLRQVYPGESWNNAYSDIRAELESQGFQWQQGSLYFGIGVDAVHTVLAAQRLAHAFPWFDECVRDIRMMRIEDNNDLMPAVRMAKR